MATIMVEVVDDEIAEGNETYFVRLLPAAGVLLRLDRTEITITDNDGRFIAVKISRFNCYVHLYRVN